MKNVIVDSNTHKNTKVLVGHGQDFGENIHFVPVIADELRSLILEYPCCLLKNNQTGQFGLHALLGFESGENLFLADANWRSHYIPLHIRRQPFMVARKDHSSEPMSETNTVLTIDMNNRRVVDGNTSADSQDLFTSDGKPTEYLTSMNRMVFELAQGIVRTESFIQSLVDNELVEAIQLGISMNKRHSADKEQENINFDGLYVINEKALANLSADLLQEYHRKGYLQACHLMMASMGQIQSLIRLRNQSS
ncbi:SapC family protein [Shewanella electrodiphila]|uniref:SapC family protein n=1 Tax=Shewanella electrodiphila TaxID=934143 RepID=A0ABT0KQ82_9GAMM|nr:SapC family protein [Shewanella electrodiphila]MCL1046022.1 SapC family protein [Shewanella electrodiphila]